MPERIAETTNLFSQQDVQNPRDRELFSVLVSTESTLTDQHSLCLSIATGTVQHFKNLPCLLCTFLVLGTVI